MLTLDAQVHAYERNHPGRPWVFTVSNAGAVAANSYSGTSASLSTLATTSNATVGGTLAAAEWRLPTDLRARHAVSASRTAPASDGRDDGSTASRRCGWRTDHLTPCSRLKPPGVPNRLRRGGVSPRRRGRAEADLY